MTDWSPVDLLPGLVFGALALLLLAALRRGYDPVPLRIAAVFGAVLLVLFGPVLFGGELLLPLDGVRGQVPFLHLPEPAAGEPHGNLIQGDLLQLVAPSLAAVRTAYGEGRWPLLNPLAGSGMPLLADPQSQALQPMALATLPLPWWRAVGVMAALRVLLALTFTFLWMLRQGLGEGPSLAGALAFGLGGFLILWVGWPIANSAALLPAVLYAVSRCRQLGGKRDRILLVATTAALLLGGHPETIAFSLAVVVAFWVVARMPSPPGPLSRLPSPLAGRGGDLAAVVLAALVAAPALLPAIDLIPRSLRATRPVVHPVGDLAEHWLPIAAPNAYGNSRYVHYWGLANTNEDAGGFVGTITLLGALLALGPTWGSARRRPQEWLFLGIALLCLGLLSPWGPGTRRLLLPLAFSLAYLGACTLDRVRLGEMRRIAVAVAAVALGVIAWGYLTQGDPSDPERLAPLRIGWLHWQGRFLVLGTLLLVLGKGRKWTAPVLAGLIAAELLLAHLPANPPMDKRLLLPVTGPIRFLQDHLREGGRMAALGRSFPPNLASLYGLADIRVYNPMAPAAYLQRLEPAITGWWGELPELGNPGHPIYAELGVRYILTAPGETLPTPFRPVFEDADGRIWEVPGATPNPLGPPASRRPHTPIPGFFAGMLLAAVGLAIGAALFVRPPAAASTAPGAPTRSAAPG